MISVGRVLHNKNYDIVGQHLLDFLQIVNIILDSVTNLYQPNENQCGSDYNIYE